MVQHMVASSLCFSLFVFVLVWCKVPLKTLCLVSCCLTFIVYFTQPLLPACSGYFPTTFPWVRMGFVALTLSHVQPHDLSAAVLSAFTLEIITYRFKWYSNPYWL